MTAHGYAACTRGCRCGTCRAAKAGYMRARRAAARAQPVPLAGGIRHGTRFAYEERGCRCMDCCNARRLSDRDWHGRKRGHRCTSCGYAYGSAGHDAACMTEAAS